MSSLDRIYKQLGKDLGINNVHAIPRIEKVVLNVGVGKNRESKEFVQAVMHDLAAITGQYPQRRPARRSVSGFNVRTGNVIGYRVTLRGQRMADFIQKFIHITLPRVRDFQGLVATSLDGQGNVSVGLKEQLAFPEIHPDKTDVIFGLEVTFVTSAVDDRQALSMFRALGFPFPVSSDKDRAARTTAAQPKQPPKLDQE